MNRLFVDTSAFAAVVDNRDTYHSEAIAYQNQILGKYRLVTSNYILDELYTLLLMNVGYQKTVDFKQKLDKLAQIGILEIVWVEALVAQQAWEVFEQFNVDKQWSFTDCVSCVIMKQLRITETFTFDRHFSQMGFVRRPNITKK